MPDDKAGADAPAPKTTPVAPETAATQVGAAKSPPKHIAAIERAVSAWVATLHDSHLSRSTPAWNFLHGRIDALKATLAKEFNEL